MDPITVATTAVSLLSPYLLKGAEEFAKELGKEVAQKVGDVYKYLKNTFTGDSEESQVLSLFEKKPEKYGTNLADVLEERAKSDKDFAAGLEKHLSSVGPVIKVVQSLKDVEKVAGADVKNARGTYDIQQQVEKGKDITGFKAENA